MAREKDLLDKNSIILGIAQDNPMITDPKNCRYDTCLVISDKLDTKNSLINFGEIVGGKYCVFMINHTADAMQKAWNQIFIEISKGNYVFDDSRPIVERYAMQMVNNHYCELCVPIV